MDNQRTTCYFCVNPPLPEKLCCNIKLCASHFYYCKTVYSRFKDHPYNNYLDLNLKKFEGFFKKDLNFYESPEIYTKDEWEKSKLVLINHLLQKQNQLYIESHTNIITQIAYCPIKNIIATLDFSHTIRIWDYSALKQIYKLTNDSKIPYNQSNYRFNIKISKYSEFIACGSDFESVHLWYYKKGESVYIKNIKKKINSVYFINDEKQLIAVSNQDAYIVDMGNLVVTHSINIESNSFLCEVSEMGKIIIITKSYSSFIKIFDAYSGTLEKECKLSSISSSSCLDSNGNLLALLYSSRKITIMDLNTLKTEAELEGHSERIDVILFTPTSSHLISGGLDYFILIWSLHSYSIESKIPLNSFGITSAVHMGKDNILAIGTLNSMLKFIDLNNTQTITCAPGHNDQVLSLAVNNTYDKIASGSHDRCIILWNVSDKNCITKYDAHDSCVNCLCFSNKDKFLVSGGIDMAVKVWDLENFQLICRFDGHDLRVEQVFVSSDDRLVVSGSGDFTFKVWEIGNGYKGFACFDSLAEKIESFSRSGKYIVVTKFLSFKILKIRN